MLFQLGTQCIIPIADRQVSSDGRFGKIRLVVGKQDAGTVLGGIAIVIVDKAAGKTSAKTL